MTKLTKEQIEFGKEDLGMTNLTEEYIPLTEPDENGFTDVCYRVAHGFDISGYSKEQLDIYSSYGFELPHIAAYFNNIKALEYLDNLGINLESKKNKLIHFAAEHGLTEIVKLLIGKGTNIHASDVVNLKPIHYAAWHGHLEIVALLIDNGADIHVGGELDQLPIAYAIETGHKEVVALFIQNGANIHAPDNIGKLPIHLAAQCGRKEIVELLIENGADIHAPSSSNDLDRRAIHYAAGNGHKETVELLIRKYKASKEESKLNTILTENDFSFFSNLFKNDFRFKTPGVLQKVLSIFAKLYKQLDEEQKIALEAQFANNQIFKLFLNEAIAISKESLKDIESAVSILRRLGSKYKEQKDRKEIISKTADLYSRLKSTIQDPDKFIDFVSLKLAAKFSTTAQNIHIAGLTGDALNHIFAYITGNDGINYAEALNINHPIQVISTNDITGPDQTPDIAMTDTKVKTL